MNSFDTIISEAELNERLGRNDIRIIDCRFNIKDPEEGRRLYEKSHIPGSVYAHLDEDLSGKIVPGKTGRHTLPNPTEFLQKIEKWSISNDDQVVAYDQSHGGLAARLWWLLKWMGHEKVAVLDGGLAAWTQAELPVTDEIKMPIQSNFEKRTSVWTVKSAAEVLERVLNERGGLVDSRSKIRYDGIEETLDPIAGHIPTAINRPFLNNLTNEGRWKSRSDLREEWNSILQGTEPQDAIIYCGSGVTACHNILSISHAGLDSANLYSGSWSEWITDPNHPLVLKSQET